jgi:ABC-type transport system substrate-binding protein
MAEVPGGWNTGLDKNPERIPVNGPYRVSAWEQGQSLTLERNDRYCGPRAATALLEEAGYAKGADGIYAKDGRPLSLRISTTAGNQLRETQEQLIQAQLKQIGVDIKIVNADSTKFFGEWLPQGNFDIANFGWVGNQIDQQLTADMATIPLYAKPTYLAVRDRFANVGDNATQEGPFWNSGLWPRRRPSRSPGCCPRGKTLSRAGGWLGDLPGASRMVAAPAAAQAAPRDDPKLEEPT